MYRIVHSAQSQESGVTVAKVILAKPRERGGVKHVKLDPKKKEFQPGPKSDERPHRFEGGTVAGVPIEAGWYPWMFWTAMTVSGGVVGDAPVVNYDPAPNFDPTPTPSYDSSPSHDSGYSSPSYDPGPSSYDSGSSSSFDSGGSFDSGSSSF